MIRMFALIALAIPAAAIAGDVEIEHPHAHDHQHNGMTITVNKSPTCGCCKLWIAHLEESGFTVNALDSDNMSAIKEQYGVPENMRSCHTAVVNGYVIEGHVPATDIRSLLEEKPEAIGLAVPGMPLGSPGMEVPGRVDSYQVMLFDEERFSVYHDYPAPDPETSPEDVEHESSGH